MSIPIDLVGIVIIQTVLIISALVQFIEPTFFHEWGHLQAARSFVYTFGEIRLKYAVPLFSIKDCKIIKDPKMKSEGETQLSNKYQPYSDDEIIFIAKAGPVYAAKFCIFVGIIELVAIYKVCEFMIRDDYCLKVAMIDLMLALIVSLAFAYLQELKYKRAKEPWCDRKIVNDPAGFKKYISEDKEE